MSQNPVASPPTSVEAGPCDTDVARVSALLVSLQRTLKSFRLYAEDHPVLRSAVAEFHEELGRVLEPESELVLRVSQGRITWLGATVHESPDRDEGLAFRLFIHGVREIAFLQGVPLAEVFDLCVVLHRTLRSRTAVDDLLSLLWEKDFTFITFIVLEDFLEDADRTEFDRFLEEGRSGETPRSSLRATVKPTLERLIAQAPPAESGRFPGIFHLPEGERARLDALVDEERNRDLSRELAIVALSLAEQCPEQEDAEILSILTRSLLSQLSEGGFRGAASLARELLAFADSAADPRARRAVREALAAVDPDHLLEVLRPYLVRVRAEDLDRLSDVFFALGPGAHRAIERLLDEEPTRNAAIELLRRGGPDLLPILLARLGSPSMPPEALVRLMAAASESGGSGILGALAAPLRHADVAVRREAFRVLRRVGTDASFPLLRDALFSPDLDTRLLAIGALDGLPPASYRDTLLRIAEDPDFPSRDYFEKRGILLALGRARDRTSEEFLLRAVRRRSLLHRQAAAEVRACAVAALGLRGSEIARAEIRRALSDPSPAVRQAAAAALPPNR